MSISSAFDFDVSITKFVVDVEDDSPSSKRSSKFKRRMSLNYETLESMVDREFHGRHTHLYNVTNLAHEILDLCYIVTKLQKNT